MMSTTHKTIPQSVTDRIESRYRSAPKYHDLFFWLWDEVKGGCPEAACRITKRYVGFYPSEKSRGIFAYIDPQQAGLFIGIFKTLFNKVKPHSYKPSHFPDWNSSRPLVGLLVQEKNPEIIKILVAAFKARVNGLSIVQPIQNPMDTEINHLLPQAKKDIQAWEQEEDRFEGKKRSRYSNYYERDPKLRAQAIAVHGTTCMVESCAFNFQEVYGNRGKDFIEVHHLEPLNTIDPNARQRTNPKKDMAVVCSNCHRMIHRCRDSILSIEEVNALIWEQSKQNQ